MDLGALNNLSARQIAKLIEFANAGDDEQIDGDALHAEKNAPWVNGTYSHLLDPQGRLKTEPAYVHQEFPKMLYSAGYLKAAQQYQGARMMRAKRGDDEEREYLIARALDAMNACTRIVQNPDEQAALGSLWQPHPTLAVEAKEMLDLSIAQAAAESAFDDRNMGELAKREREAADDESEGHLVEVGETPIPTHQRRRGRPARTESAHD